MRKVLLSRISFSALMLTSLTFIFLFSNFASAGNWDKPLGSGKYIYINDTVSNSSIYWNDLYDINSTQLKDDSGILSIKTSWLESFINSITKWASYYTKTEIDNKGYLTSESDPAYYSNPNAYYNSTTLPNIDLSPYYNKTEVNNILLNYYNETEVDSLINSLNNSFGNYYNKTEVDSLINGIPTPDLTIFYNKTEVDNLLNNYYPLSNPYGYLNESYDDSWINNTFYNQTQVDNLLNNIDLSAYYNKTESDSRYLIKAYGVSSSSATTTSKSLTISNYEVSAGDIIAVKFTYGSTTTQSWNLLLNGVWYYDILVAGSKITAEYLLLDAGAVVLFYYDGMKMSVINPAYSNSYKWVSLEENYERPAETIYGYKMAWKDGNNRYRPIIKTSGTTGNNKYPNTAGFLLGGKMVINPTSTTYGTSSIMDKNIKYIGTVGATYNINSALTAYLPLYFKGRVNETDGLFYFNQDDGYTGWYTQTLPTTEDGFVYVYVGNAQSGTYSIGLSLDHPAYEFKDGRIRLYGEAKNTHRDNFKEYYGTGNNASITYDGTNLVFNTSESGSGLAYFSNNVSATGYITRTSIFNKSSGTALNYIKDASEYLNAKGGINHKEFYGYVEQKVTDFSRPVIDYLPKEVCSIDKDEKESCVIEYEVKTTYPYTKIEDGVDLGKEIDVLRQAVYELKLELEKVKSETCSIKLFSWCLIK